jgi:hypothetical protein
MFKELEKNWERLKDSIEAAQVSSSLTLAVYLIIGGLLGLYLRVLYNRCSTTVSDADSVTRIFPLLTVVTTAVIEVVQTSLALSLGMVGALSIVRFRAAIKEPEELVYLFMCIAIGLTLGAHQPWLALMLVLVASGFILLMHFMQGSQRIHGLLLTVSGDADEYFSTDEKAVTILNGLAAGFSIQRFDIEAGRGQLRILLPALTTTDQQTLLAKLHDSLPGCSLSFLNMKP